MNFKIPFVSKKIKILGIVQGVGYRPFIYKIAKKYSLVGEIFNLSSGVEILIEGLEKDIQNFIIAIKDSAPPASLIEKILIKDIFFGGYTHLSIIKSKISIGSATNISPDLSICLECLFEIRDVDNRRYEYPFTNCTNCGPRYTIIKDIPYDRDKTVMSSFKMCFPCQKEYDNSLDRRFHAQPNACFSCGPSLFLTDYLGKKIETKDPILTVYSLIKSGFIVAIKGLGGFHLSVDATNEEAVSVLRNRKNRPDKPFAVMSLDLNSIKTYSFVRDGEAKILTGASRPIVLLEKFKESMLAYSVAPKSRYFGVMLPYTPLHYLLLDKGFKALVMTSGNISGQPMSINNREALLDLGKVADYFLMHDRDILARVDDSVFKYFAGKNRVLRSSRGYAPKSIMLYKSFPCVLACGAEIKNTICIVRNNKAFISQYIGNLGNWSSYSFFWETVKHMQLILKVSPEIIVCDLHPNYTIANFIPDSNRVKLVKVQHHHSHIVSCMSENKFTDPVIGLALDGTGYGLDGNIWGGEILIANYASFKKVASLELIPMPGSSAAIREPWRMAISYLYKVFGNKIWMLNLPIFNIIDKLEIEVVINMINSKLNSPYTSSLGRLFDAIASILGIRHTITYEGQGAIELEGLALIKTDKLYSFEIEEIDNFFQLSICPIIKGVILDLQKSICLSEIATKFHNTIISMFSWMCFLLRKIHKINCVALSGGVFQNRFILEGMKKNLEKNNFKVLTHSSVPSNDGGVSLGQALIALHTL